MEPETFLDGRVQLWRGDCLAVLPLLGEPFDAVIVDPPYEEEMHVAKLSARRVRTDGYASPKPVDFAAIGELRGAMTPLLRERCLGWFLAFCTPEGIAAWRDAIEDSGMRYKRACFWVKPDSAPQFNGQGPAFAVEPFVTAWCGKGMSRWNGGGRRNHFTFPTNDPQRQGDHSTEKPLALMLELVRLFTQPDAIVCDPCMGSGTTIIAAAALGRRAIGIEKDPKHYALARARIESAFMGRGEGARHIVRQLGKTEHAGPLFGGTE